MAGIEFDRQAFVQAEQARRNSIMPLLGLIAGALVLAVVAYFGYKFISSSSPASPAVETQALGQIQEQLAEMNKRIDDLEKRHHTAVPEVTAPASQSPVGASATPRPGYKVRGASALAPQAPPARDPTLATKAFVEQHSAATSADIAANREAWQATSDRLADVVGVVGSQQGEISQTREDVNQILSKTVRSALPFELRRGAVREPVGPVSLLLKNTDVKGQRYTVCIYIADQCIELKNRAVNEVVGFALARGSAPLEFVATKVLHDQIVGYLEVPGTSKH